MAQKTTKMTRKEFLKKSSAAALGFGLLRGSSMRSIPVDPVQTNLPRRTLGRTGISVTTLGFGASRTMEASLVKAALDSGINFLDSGRSYFRGRNEVMLGGVLKGIRQEVVIQSKLKLGIAEQPGKIPTAQEVERMKKTMADSLQASLDAYGTDYIDIMLIHGATSPELSHHEEVLEFFTGAKKAGKIRAHGFSSHTNQVEMMKAAIEHDFFDVIMVPYNHKGSFIHMNSGRFSEWDQPALEVELDKALKKDIGLIAMKTCSGGPYAREGSGKVSFEGALRWLLEGGRVHTMAVAMANFDQLEENLRAVR